MPGGVHLSDAEIAKTLRDHGLKTANTGKVDRSARGKRFTFATTTLVADDPKTRARILELSVDGSLESKVLVITRIVSGEVESPKVVEGTVIPLVHRTWSKTITGRTERPRERKPPDATLTYGWCGFALSFSEPETQAILNVLRVEGDVAAVIAGFAAETPVGWIWAVAAAIILLGADYGGCHNTAGS